MEALIYTPTVDPEEAITACSLSQQQPSGSNLAFLSAHINFSCVIVSFVLRLVAAGWSICSKLVRNTTFFQNTSVALLNFQPRSDPLGLFVEQQGHMYDMQLLDNKSLFQSLLSLHEVVWWYVLDLYSSSVWTNSGLEHWISSLWFFPVPPDKYQNSTSLWP